MIKIANILSNIDTDGIDPRADLEALANSIEYSQNNINGFGRAIHERQRVHDDESLAKERFNLRTVPVRGTRFAAIGGRLGRELEAIAKILSPEYCFVGQNISFRDPVLLGDNLIWKIGEIGFLEEKLDTILIPIEVRNKEEGNTKEEIRVKIQNLISKTRPKLLETDPNSLIYSGEILPYSIPPEEIIEYHEAIGEKAQDHIVPLYLTGRTTGLMVEFLERLNERFGTDYICRNISMKSRFHRDFDPSKRTQIEIYEIRTPIKPNRGYWAYKFRGVVKQNNNPVVTTDITTFSDGKLETRVFRPEFRLAA